MASISKCPTMLAEALKILMRLPPATPSKIINSPSDKRQANSLPNSKKTKTKFMLFHCINIPTAMVQEVPNSLFQEKWMGAPKELALPCRDINEDPL